MDYLDGSVYLAFAVCFSIDFSITATCSTTRHPKIEGKLKLSFP